MIAIGSDHGGFNLKEEIKKYFDECGIEYKDFGTNSLERTDYPIFAKAVSKSIQNKECDLGILICKTGVGMTIVANKFKGIRCATCLDESDAKMAKEHSNINVLALSAEKLSASKAIATIRMWLGSNALDGRYNERLEMIKEIENENMK